MDEWDNAGVSIELMLWRNDYPHVDARAFSAAFVYRYQLKGHIFNSLYRHGVPPAIGELRFYTHNSF